jgi:hypothetical protein
MAGSATETTSMATATVLPVRKYKASDLPLPSATRAAIDSLVHSFKKKGDYDAIRKQVWGRFEATVCSFPVSLVALGC